MRNFALALILSSGASHGADPGDLFKRAKTLEDAGRSAEARQAFRALISSQGAPPHDQALALMELSRMDLSAGKYSESVAQGRRSVNALRALGDASGEGLALTIVGLAETYASNYDAALNDFGRALKIARETNDRKQEITRLNNIAIAFYYQGRYADALDRLATAMRLVDRSAAEQWNPSRRQLTVANVGIVYQSLGQYDRALETYAWLSAASDKLEIQERAQLLSNIGALYRRLGDPVKALTTYREARGLYQRRQLVPGEIKLLNNIGIALAQDLRRYREALDSFGEALKLASGSGERLGYVQSLLFRGQTYFLMGRQSEAEADFQGAATGAQNLHASEERWKALYGMARIAYDRGDVAQAKLLLRESISLIESLRAKGPNTLLSGFLGDKRVVYDLLIQAVAVAPRPDPAELFSLMELSRARGLQDRKTILAKPSLDMTRAKLPPRTVLLEYWAGEDSLLVLWANRDHAGTVFKRQLPNLRRKLLGFNALLSQPRQSNWREQARVIAQDIVGPVAARLNTLEVDKLVIVPDREIALIPFEVLPLPGSPVDRLVDRYALSYLPSASLLQAIGAERQTAPFWHRTLLAFGDPAPFGGHGSFSMPSSRDATRLPGAAEEVLALQAIAGGKSSVFTGAIATKENLKRGLQANFPFVHLATHAFADPEDQARSYVLLAGGAGRQGYDYLFLKEIQDLELKHVQLVTLSACSTERGKLVEGEGMSGFGNALLGAGARAVVSSLWQVDDAVTARLMESFYSEMEAGQPAAEALRRAKILTAKEHMKPFYWSAFVLSGQADVRLPLVIGWKIPLALLLGSVSLGLLFFLRFKRSARRA